MPKFLFPILMLTPFLLPGQAPILAEYLQKWANATAYTTEVVELMSEDDFKFQPTEDQQTFQDQILHMVRNMNWLASSYLGGEKLPYDLKTGQFTPQEVKTILKEGFEASKAAVEKLPVEELDETVDFFAGPMSKRQILVLMNDHLTHHRAQIIVYLRLKGIKPPKYRGW